ncbi:MAG: zinc-ribbon domain-containing protein [Desulfuromonadales bacterium]|nr:zinc-ribbon domain-containing protein [Desulfuromonadales bacterium]
MIIQCEQCQTKFKLDDSKVADKSIKVRCARCKHVFSVARTQSVAEDSDSFWQDEIALPTEAEQKFETPLQATALDIVPETPQQNIASKSSGFLDSDPFEMPELPAASLSSTPDNHDDGFSFDSIDSAPANDQLDTPEDHDEMDFGAFDFDDATGDADESSSPAASSRDFSDKTEKQASVASPPAKEFGGLDFSGDDMFGELASTGSDEEAHEPISFDVGMEDFADSMGVEGASSGQKMSLSAQEPSTENPFSLDDIDFGDELSSVAVQQVSTEELKPSQDLLFAPLVTNETEPELHKAQAAPIIAPADQEELPPLSIASRRKESPRISGMLLLLGVLIAGLVVFYSYWGYTTLTEEKSAATTAPQEAGRITLRSVEASFVKNKTLGNLLIIRGEAVNEYNKPRAAIQVKGSVFGADGKEIASKSAFCGNPLSEEQLATMPMDKIEAAMANQFGDSLANMEVAAGDAIPFVVVIPQPATGAKDYGVEPVGSTVATAKEK